MESRRLFSLPAGAGGVDLDALAANPHDPTQIVVRFRSGVADAVRGPEVLAGTEVGRPVGLDYNLRAVRLGGGVGVAAALARYRHNPLVEYAEPNWTYTTQAVSAGKYYDINLLWGMYGNGTTPANQYGSQAGEAWAAGATGSSKVFVGVIDEGVDYTHPDLYRNVAINQGEIPASVRAALNDVDGDGVISFADLNNDAANRGSVRDGNTNGYIDGHDLLAPLGGGGWADRVDGDAVAGETARTDDLVGWDFFANDNRAFDGPGDDHGTHVAGTIGASGGPDAYGVAGVNWDVGLISAKFLAPGGGSLVDAVEAVDYFTDLKLNHGVNVVATNNSWGGGGYSQALQEAINRGAKADILFVAAAGNGNTAGVGQNNDSRPYYPANYNTEAAAGYDAVISVAAIDKTGARARFSNYGKTTVDLAAPGVTVFSTVPMGADTVDYTPDGYAASSGTSMAAPHVTGAAALYAAKYMSGTGQTPTARSIKDALLQSAKRTPTGSVAVNGKTPVATGGRLNIPEALAVAPVYAPTVATAAAPALTAGSTGTTSAAGQLSTAAIRPAGRTGVWALLEDQVA